MKKGFSNDFAQWVYTDLREIGLGERFAALDVRKFTSLGKLRERLIQIIEEFMAVTARAKDCSPRTPFYFCSSKITVLSTQSVVSTLLEFVAALKEVSLHSMHYRFIEARLRRKLENFLMTMNARRWVLLLRILSGLRS